MKRFWEELDEKDLEILEESLDPGMTYEGEQGIWNKFEMKCVNSGQNLDLEPYQNSETSRIYETSKRCNLDGIDESNEIQKPGRVHKTRVLCEKEGNIIMVNKKKRRKLILVLAAVLVLVCGIGVAASYGTWHLTNPGTYQGDSVKVHGTSSYVWDEDKQAYVNENGEVVNSSVADNLEENAAGSQETQQNEGGTPLEEETDLVNGKFSDEYFLERTQEILGIIGKEKIDMSKMQITYQKDENWNREEVMVSFPLSQDEGNYSHVTFIKETGDFLGASIWGNESEEDGPLMSEEEALEVACSWYEKLPYPQGYVYANVSKYDDHCWMYSFCHQVDVEINGEKITMLNAYEEARISIDPTNGQLILCNSFYVPLLDDHKEGDKPLTEAQAREIADQVISNPEETEITAEIGIVHPNYEMAFDFSGQEGERENGKGGNMTDDVAEITDEIAFTSYRYDQVTRLAWTITYERPNTEFADITYVSVDLYTGEILTRDITA